MQSIFLLVQHPLDDKPRPRFGLVVHLADILANDAQAQQLNAADHPDRGHQRRPPRLRGAHQLGNQRPDERDDARHEDHEADRQDQADGLYAEGRDAVERKGEHLLERVLALARKALRALVFYRRPRVADLRHDAAQKQIDLLELRKALHRAPGHQAVVRMVEHDVHA